MIDSGRGRKSAAYMEVAKHYQTLVQQRRLTSYVLRNFVFRDRQGKPIVKLKDIPFFPNNTHALITRCLDSTPEPRGQRQTRPAITSRAVEKSYQNKDFKQKKHVGKSAAHSQTATVTKNHSSATHNKSPEFNGTNTVSVEMYSRVLRLGKFS